MFSDVKEWRRRKKSFFSILSPWKKAINQRRRLVLLQAANSQKRRKEEEEKTNNFYIRPSQKKLFLEKGILDTPSITGPPRNQTIFLRMSAPLYLQISPTEERKFHPHRQKIYHGGTCQKKTKYAKKTFSLPISAVQTNGKWQCAFSARFEKKFRGRCVRLSEEEGNKWGKELRLLTTETYLHSLQCTHRKNCRYNIIHGKELGLNNFLPISPIFYLREHEITLNY